MQTRSHQVLAALRPIALAVAFGGFGLVLVMALSDTLKLQQMISGQDKIEHFVAFGCLGFWFGLRASVRAFVFYALLLFGLAFAIEALQARFTLTREAGLADALVSVGGAMCGLCAALGAGRLVEMLCQRVLADRGFRSAQAV